MTETKVETRDRRRIRKHPCSLIPLYTRGVCPPLRKSGPLCFCQQQPPFPGSCSKECLIFSSSKHNCMLMCITMQRKVEKIQRQKSKLELKLPETARGQKTSYF